MQVPPISAQECRQKLANMKSQVNRGLMSYRAKLSGGMNKSGGGGDDQSTPPVMECGLVVNVAQKCCKWLLPWARAGLLAEDPTFEVNSQAQGDGLGSTAIAAPAGDGTVTETTTQDKGTPPGERALECVPFALSEPKPVDAAEKTFRHSCKWILKLFSVVLGLALSSAYPFNKRGPNGKAASPIKYGCTGRPFMHLLYCQPVAMSPSTSFW